MLSPSGYVSALRRRRRKSTNRNTEEPDACESIADANPVKAPYDLTGNIFIKMGKCNFKEVDTAFRYQVVDEDDFCAIHPKRFSLDEYDGEKNTLINRFEKINEQYSTLCLGESKVLTKIEGSYYYQLIGQGKKQVLWRSCEGFGSPGHAYVAFKEEFFELIELAKEEENYVEGEWDGEKVIFLQRGERDFPAIITPEELEKTGIRKAKMVRINHALQFPVIRKGSEEESNSPKNSVCRPIQENRQNAENQGFQFQVLRFEKKRGWLKPIEVDWEGLQIFQNPIDAWFGFLNCLELMGNEINWLPANDKVEDDLQIAIGEVNLQSKTNYVSRDLAWEGTNHFAQELKNDSALELFTDYWKDCCYGFRALGSEYHLATHPIAYDNLEGRAVAMDCLRVNAHKRDQFFELVESDIITPIENTECYGYLVCATNFDPGIEDKELWQGVQSFEKMEDAEKAYEENHIKIMNLARDAENYYFRKISEDQCRVVLCNQRKEIIAFIPREFNMQDSIDRFNQIVYRIKKAHLFPIKETPSGFQFDIYDFDFDCGHLLSLTWGIIDGSPAEDYCKHHLEDPPLNPPADCGEEEKKYLVENIAEKVKGEIILESVKSYTTQSGIYEVIQWLTNHDYLFRQLNSYQGVQTENTGPFYIHWVNPKEILAESPRRFLLPSDGVAALEQARSKINSEGLHLVEHILLRPINQPKEYTLKARNENGNTILFSARQYYESVVKDEKGNNISTPLKKFKDDIQKAAQAIKLSDDPEKRIIPVQEWRQKLEITDEQGKIIGIGCHLPQSLKEYETLIKDLRKLTKDDVEPIHYREKFCDERLFEICIDPQDCQLPSSPNSTSPFENFIPGADPYSFWVTIVIPYWPQRFQNTNFRAFFENTIRRELPAYIMPRIVWANPRDMNKFEIAYCEWLRAKSTLVQEQCKVVANPFSLSPNDCLDLQLMPTEQNGALDGPLEQFDEAQKELMKVLNTITSEFGLARTQRQQSTGNNNVALLDQMKLA